MKVKTKEDALLHCFDLWLWLALNPEKHKTEWLGWEFNGGYLNSCHCDCPVCDLANSCLECSLDWPGEDCLERESPFRRWDICYRTGKRELSTKYALEICELAIDAM